MSTVYMHSWTPLPWRDAWRVFAAASAGGGTPAEWTETDDPEHAIPPADAAGSLWRAGERGIPETVAIVRDDFVRRMLDSTAAEAVAAYFSCGGQGVFLLRVAAAEVGYVLVARPDEERARRGAREQNIAHAMGGDEVVLFAPAVAIGVTEYNSYAADINETDDTGAKVFAAECSLM